MFLGKHLFNSSAAVNKITLLLIKPSRLKGIFQTSNLSATSKSVEISHSKVSKNFKYKTKMTQDISTDAEVAGGDPSKTQVVYLDVPDKSESDKKIYKTIQLRNGLRALLVSDPSPVPHDGFTTSSETTSSEGCDDSCAEETSETSETSESSEVEVPTSSDSHGTDEESEQGDEKLAACALLVDVGSFSETKKAPGLAHFLEHMIFMGSKKYPAENAFDAHIKKCGGFDNANTDAEETLFYFEISEEHLDSSLDYFTNLFKEPLMKKEAMTRERDAVDSEFQQVLLNDEVRRDQLLANVAGPGYPHGTFAWGNNKSLRDDVDDDDELYQMVHDFRIRHYSAHRMYVCVQARLPIDELEGLVVKHFSEVPSNYLPGVDFRELNYRDAFLPEFHEQVFLMKPEENVCKLDLTWVLPPMNKHYRCKPDQFFSYLIGYEGEGSLCAYLRKKLWGLELICGVDEGGFDTNSIYTLFNLCIYLTDSGFEHIDEVLKATFAYIKLLSGNEPSLKEAYTELQHIEANSFRFESQKAAFDNVQQLVLHSKLYPPKDIITGSELYFEYNAEEVMDVVQHLNEFKFNIMITSQQKYENIAYDRKEKWFGTEYTTIAMPAKWREMWDNSQPMPELHLPNKNPFISSDFTLFWQESGKPEIPLAPKKLMQTDTCELWFRQDDRFNLPNAHMYFYMISPLLRQDVKNDVMCALYAQLVKFCLCEELYPATVANLGYQFYSSEKGVVLKAGGYNEKLHLVVETIVKAMANIREHITSEQLETFKINQKKSYFNSLIKPKTLNKDIRLCIIENIRWPMIQKYKVLESITLSDMLDFADKFTKELYVQTLIQGNLTEENAHNVMNNVLSILNTTNIKDPKYVENRTVQLPQGSHYIRTHALNEKDTNTVICNFYQIGPCSVLIESILDLLMMFVEEPLFDQLRTKLQLGYYVGAAVRLTYGIAGYSITVNSQETKFSADHVEERIEEFRENMLTILRDMPDDEFEHVRESLIKIKSVVDTSLYEEVYRNWGEITNEDYLFDRRRKEIETIKVLTKQDIIDFCVHNERTNLRKLSVQVIGHKKDDKKEEIDEAELVTENVDDSEYTDVTEETSDDMEVDEEELFNALANKLEVVYLPKEGDATTIVDIDDFKENLHVFPITKTKVEDDSKDVRFKQATDTQNIMEEL